MSRDPNVKCNPLLQSTFYFSYHWQNTALNNVSSLLTNERDQVSFQDFIKLQELLGNDSASLCCCILGNNNKKKRLLFQSGIYFKLIQCHSDCGLKELLGNCLFHLLVLGKCIIGFRSICFEDVFLEVLYCLVCLFESLAGICAYLYEWVCQESMEVPSQVCNADSLAIKGMCFVLISKKEDLNSCLQKPFSCLQCVRHFAAPILRNYIPYLKLEFSWKSLKYKQYVNVLLT